MHIGAVVLAIALELGALGAAQESATPQGGVPEPANWACRDDRGVERCYPAAIAEQNQIFGVADLASLNRDGSIVRRAFFINGYGHDLLAITFIRPRGGDAMLEVAAPRRGDQLPVTMRTNISENTWAELLRRGAFFDRDLAPIPANSDDERTCLHSGIFRVEASDPPQQSPYSGGAQLTENRVIQLVRGTCNENLATNYAMALADVALAALPPCTSLSSENERNAVTRLYRCVRLLSGDRIAAAQAHDAVRWLSTLGEARAATEPWLESRFAENAVIQIEGATVGEGRAASAAFARWFDTHSGLHFHAGPVRGDSPDSAVTTGTVTHAVGVDQERTAPLTIRWTRRFGQMVIERLEIGTFATMRN